MYYQNQLEQCDTEVYEVESYIESIVIDRSMHSLYSKNN